MENGMNRKMRRLLDKNAKKELKIRRMLNTRGFNTMRNVLKEFGFVIEKDYLSWLKTMDNLKIKISEKITFDNGVTAVYLTPSTKGVEITLIEIRKEFQGMGIGGSMLDFILLKMWENDIWHVSLYPASTNENDTWSIASDWEKLEKFYAKRGFVWSQDKKEMELDWEAFEDYIDSRNLNENLDLSKVFFTGNPDLRMAA
jgi:GNAT superfamily N-acetyltransferase